MKHPSSRAFFAYWDERRGNAAAPDRAAFEPGAIRSLLGDIFVVACEARSGYPFRVAGTRLGALLGRDLKGESLLAQFASDSRHDGETLLDIAAFELRPITAGLTAVSDAGESVPLELLLLPFAPRPYTPATMTGLLAPLKPMVRGPLADLRTLSWRIVGREQRRFGPRVMRKWQAARGLTVYDGMR